MQATVMKSGLQIQNEGTVFSQKFGQGDSDSLQNESTTLSGDTGIFDKVGDGGVVRREGEDAGE